MFPPVTSTTPQITSVTFSGSGQNLGITITGSGFGSAPLSMPFTGDLNYFAFVDFRQHVTGSSLFGAGSNGWGIVSPTIVTMVFESWSNNQIQISGFAGTYGQGGATVETGDPVVIIIYSTSDAQDTGPQTAWGGNVPSSAQTHSVTVISQGSGSVTVQSSAINGGTSVVVGVGQKESWNVPFDSSVALTEGSTSGNAFGLWTVTSGINGPGWSPVDTSSPTIQIVVTGDCTIQANFIQTLTESNWAGYMVMGSSQQPVTAISGSWIVQSVAPTLSPSFSSQWIGIGGSSGGYSLLQIGTASDSIADQTVCYAWYEELYSIGGVLVPVPPVPLLNTVKPSDVMAAEIFLDKTTNYWNLVINDLTQNWQFSHTLTVFAPSTSSAEWIEENQESGIAHLANFGVAKFFSNYATIGSTTASISSFCASTFHYGSSFAISMVDSTTQQTLVQPSPLTNDGSFSVTWYGGGTVPKLILVPIVLSPANLFVTDPQGRSIGFNPSTGGVVNYIPDALYSGPGTEPQFVLIPNPINGTYSITLVGTANGNYTLVLEYVTSTQTTTQTFNGTISQQEKESFSAAISGTNMGFYMNAGIEIKPETLNLGSKGKWITAYIELYKGVNVSSINVSSISLNGTIPVAAARLVVIDDHDDNRTPERLMVKFDRAQVAQLILNSIDKTERFMKVTLTITGNLNDGTPFHGSDVITVIYMAWRCGGQDNSESDKQKP